MEQDNALDPDHRTTLRPRLRLADVGTGNQTEDKLQASLSTNVIPITAGSG